MPKCGFARPPTARLVPFEDKTTGTPICSPAVWPVVCYPNINFIPLIDNGNTRSLTTFIIEHRSVGQVLASMREQPIFLDIVAWRHILVTSWCDHFSLSSILPRRRNPQWCLIGTHTSSYYLFHHYGITATFLRKRSHSSVWLDR